MENVEHENGREKADAGSNTSHFEGVTGVLLFVNTDVARLDVSCSKGKILALEALLPLDLWSNSEIT